MKKKSKTQAKDILYKKSREVFQSLYEKDSQIYILLARHSFEKAIENNELSVSDGFRVVNTPSLIGMIVKEAQKKHETQKEQALQQKVDSVIDQTKPSLALKMAVGVNAAFLVAATLLSPIATPYVQNAVDWLFGRSKKIETTAHCPTYSPTIINNNNYHFCDSLRPTQAPNPKQPTP